MLLIPLTGLDETSGLGATPRHTKIRRTHGLLFDFRFLLALTAVFLNGLH